MLKYSHKIVAGLHDDVAERPVYHILIIEHEMHEDRPRDDGQGYECSGAHVVETAEAYTESAARLLAFERLAVWQRVAAQAA